MNTSENIDAIAAALSKMQAVMAPATKDQDNPFFKSKYADLTGVWDVCRKPLTDNGLSVTQVCDSADNGDCIVVTRLMHSSGQWIESRVPCYLVGKATPQALGSAITYARRYGLSAILGITSDDDDGEAAEGRGQAVAKKVVAKSIPRSQPTAGTMTAWNDFNKSTTKNLPNYAPKATLWNEYIIDFGKYKGTALKDMKSDDAASYCDWLRNQPKASPKTSNYINMYEKMMKDKSGDSVAGSNLPPAIKDEPWPDGM